MFKLLIISLIIHNKSPPIIYIHFEILSIFINKIILDRYKKINIKMFKKITVGFKMVGKEWRIWKNQIIMEYCQQM